MAEGPEIPRLTKAQIVERAALFLKQNHPSKTIPVPVEQMVEHLGLDIVPIPGLRKNFDLEASTSVDKTRLYVDRWIAEHRENRYRFSLAHELGHIVLHSALFDNIQSIVPDFAAWAEFTRSLPDVKHGSLEWQAYTFAGLILVPPGRLAEEYERVLPGIRQRIREAENQGIPKQDAAEFAWDELASRIAPRFQVSKEVILKRLAFDGFTPSKM